MNDRFRYPDRYAEPVPQRRQEKWSRMIDAFMDENYNELLKIHRTGTRGRIFAFLINEMLERIQIPNEPEPIFDHIPPNKWYLDFVSKHDDIKLRTHEFYNPDYLLKDGNWLEVTLSENTAYKKLFRYGHQAQKLKVIWLDEDSGLHKQLCQNVVFSNAQVLNVNTYFSELEKVPGENALIERFEKLRDLKGIIG